MFRECVINFWYDSCSAQYFYFILVVVNKLQTSVLSHMTVSVGWLYKQVVQIMPKDLPFLITHHQRQLKPVTATLNKIQLSYPRG